MFIKVAYTLLFFTTSSRAIPCKDGETEHGGNCYKLYTEKKNYDEAEATCKGVHGGGDLVTVDTPEMQQFVRTEMHKNANIDKIWMGAKVTKTDWRWVTSGKNLKYQGCFSNYNNAGLSTRGSSKTDNTPDSCIAECYAHKYAGVKMERRNVVCYCGDQYTADTYEPNFCDFKCSSDKHQTCGSSGRIRIYSVDSAGAYGWAYHQPNNLDGNQRCLALYRDDPYEWADYMCDDSTQKYGYLCEYGSSQNGCQMHAGKCYTQHSNTLSWYKARAECMKNGGDLLQFDTTEFYDVLKDKDSNLLDANVRRWWIGATKQNWQWPSGAHMTYENWNSDQPNSPLGYCAVVNKYAGSDGYKWDSKKCYERHGFMCWTGEVTITTPTTTTTTSTTTTTTTTVKPTTTTTTTKQTATKATTPATKTPKPTTKATKPTTKVTEPTTKATKPTTKRVTSEPEPGKTTTRNLMDMATENDYRSGKTAATTEASVQTNKMIFTTVGLMVGAVVGAVVICIGIGGTIYCFIKNSRNSSRQVEPQITNEQGQLDVDRTSVVSDDNVHLSPPDDRTTTPIYK